MKAVLKEFYIEKNKKSGGRITPDIVKASRANDLNRVGEALRQNPDCINDQDPVSGMSALHWACANRNIEIFELLTSYPNVSITLLTFSAQSPEHLAMESGAVELADALHRRNFMQDHMNEDPYAENSNVSVFSPKDP